MRQLVCVVVVYGLTIGGAGSAAAIPRDSCPTGSVWSLAAGSCVKRKPAPKLSPQEKFDQANDHLEGRGKAPDPQQGVRLLEQACTVDKHPASCRLLGFLHARGRNPVTKDDRRALDYYRRACELADLDACVDVGDHGFRIGDYAGARAAFRVACDRGSGVACARGADLLDRAIGGGKDAELADKMFKLAMDKLAALCSGGSDGNACFVVGFMYENRKGTAKDLVKARAAFRTGCTTGHGEACMSLARSLDNGSGGPVDKDGATKSYDRACTDFDNGEACQQIAERLGIAKQDLPRAARLAKRACELDPKYCGTLAEFHRLGFGLDKADQTVATGYYKQACENGGLGWCKTYGTRLYEGTGVAQDVDGALAALERACRGDYLASCDTGARFAINAKRTDKATALATIGCDGGNGDSCFRLGSVNQGSPDKAVELYTKACKLDSPIGCNALATAYKEGTGVAKDSAKAYELFTKACAGNKDVLYAAACTTQGKMAFFGDGVTKDLKQAFIALSRACEFGEDVCQYLAAINKDAGGARADVEAALVAGCKADHLSACLAHANWQLEGNEADKRTAYQAVVKLCKGGYETACLRQAELLSFGLGVTKDEDKAAEVFRELCDKDRPAGCIGLAVIRDRQGKLEEANQLATRACEADNAAACNFVGHHHYIAHGTKWDVTAAAKYFEKTCNLGLLIGCANLAEAYRFGVGVPRDHAKARELYEKSCTDSEPIGCTGWGAYLATGEGGQRVDKKRAEVVYRKSCEAEYAQPEACRGVADLLEERRGPPDQIARFRTTAFARASELAKDNPYYMYVLGKFYADGIATVKDPVKSLEWTVKACEGFDSLGCITAGKSLRDSGKPADADRARVFFERACAAGVTEGCELGSKARGPAAVGPARGCCGGQAAPSTSLATSLVVVMVVLRRRKRGGR